jgi:hypothetical protein
MPCDKNIIPCGNAKTPEAPKEGDELLYVDLTKERLENLYNEQ